MTCLSGLHTVSVLLFVAVQDACVRGLCQDWGKPCSSCLEGDARLVTGNFS